MGRVVSIFYYPGSILSPSSGGRWRDLFAHGRASVVLEPTEMNMARMRELEGIGVLVGFVRFAELVEKDMTGPGESTWHGLNSKT